MAKLEYAKFLQGTVQEMAKEVQNSRSGELKKTAEDLDEFLSRVSLNSQPIIYVYNLTPRVFVYGSLLLTG